MRRCVAFVVLLIVVAGCGDGDRDSARTPEQVEIYLEADLPRTITRGSDDTLDDVSCLHRDGNSYECLGTYRMSLRSAKRSMRDDRVDTSYFTADDWRVIIERGSGPVSYDVVVQPGTGEYIANPK